MVVMQPAKRGEVSKRKKANVGEKGKSRQVVDREEESGDDTELEQDLPHGMAV